MHMSPIDVESLVNQEDEVGAFSGESCAPFDLHSPRELAPGFAVEMDTLNEGAWSQTLQEFEDANIYQTWSYGEIIGGANKTRRLILRKKGAVVAMAQARIAKLPLLNAGIAYVAWGPLWRRTAIEADFQIFIQAVRALRNEFVCNRRLVLRLFVDLLDDQSSPTLAVLAEEGFSPLTKATRSRTILMDLCPPLSDLREGMQPHWKRELKVAERKALEVVEGSSDELFATFIGMYKEMVTRKKFVEPNDIEKFRLVQAQLPEKLKMKILLCRSEEGACAGLICSAMGNRAIYLFGATSNKGMKSNGSYLLQWRLLKRLKEEGIATYNLNGINPTRNPGTFKFKSDLAGKNGREHYYLGRFDASFPGLSSWSIACGDRLRAINRKTRQFVSTVPTRRRG
jgi:hypothetical protein